MLRPIIKNLIFLYVVGISGVAVAASSLQVTVLGKKNTPIENVVVSVIPNGDQAIDMPIRTYEMSQKDKTFTPHILTIPTGSNVIFPNMDNITHHVYSFSPTKRFDLKLFKLKSPDPITFEKPGIVVVGCNIHDWMLGYIKITNTPFFSNTDSSGIASFPELPPGDYDIEIWNPRIKDKSKYLVRSQTLSDQQSEKMTFKLKKSLRPEPDLLEDEEY